MNNPIGTVLEKGGFTLRQHIGSGEIDGQKFDAAMINGHTPAIINELSGKGLVVAWEEIAKLAIDRGVFETLTEDQFYLQDSRSYCGNDVMWWAQAGGYTTDLSKASIYNMDEAVRQHKERETDIPWPKSYIDQKTRPTVDMQYINRAEALASTGIVLIKPKRPRKETYQCYGCKRFMSAHQYWSGDCEHCGTDSRP